MREQSVHQTQADQSGTRVREKLPTRADVSSVAMFLRNSCQKPVRDEHTHVLHWGKAFCAISLFSSCECENAIQLAVAASIIICLAASSHCYNPQYLFFPAFCGFPEQPLTCSTTEPPSHFVPLRRSLLFVEYKRFSRQVGSVFFFIVGCTGENPELKSDQSSKVIINSPASSQCIYIRMVEIFISHTILQYALCSCLSRVLEALGPSKTSLLFPKVCVCVRV